MKVFRNLSVQRKLALAFGCVLVLMAFMGAISALQLSRVHDRAESILSVRLAGVRDSLGMAEAAARYRSTEYRLLLTPVDKVPDVLPRVAQFRDRFEQSRKAYEAAIADDEERALYQKAVADWQAYLANSAKVPGLLAAGSADAARETVMGAAPLKLFETAGASLKALSDYNDKHAQEDAAEARGIYHRGQVMVAAVISVAVALCVALGVVLTRAIANPLREAVGLAQAVADGDLTRHLGIEGRDELAQLGQALDAMVTRLRDIVSQVRTGVDNVSTASGQIAAGNVDLSQRTEEQAANLQETAASMDQLTSTVAHNADNARTASELAREATTVAERGGAVVGQVVSTMSEITGSSRRIADITGVIDAIAFQTNILALNAAVEAARAGELGRGFAVVASEVRTLAQRSGDAAREIKALIEQSTQKVDDGSRLVAEAGRTMDDIVQQIGRVNSLVGEISSATHEQARGIGQVGEAVQQLDQVTQQNAALVEESAAAADSMKRQAERLSQTVAVFRVQGQEEAAAQAEPALA